MKESEILAAARERFAQAHSDEADNRARGLDDLRFCLGEQWSPEERRLRIGRPTLVINKIAGVRKQLIGEARTSRPRIKVRPFDSQADPAIAELLTGLIRHIENISDAEAAYDAGFEAAITSGVGYWRVTTEYSSDTAFEQDILIRRIVNPFAVYYDQSATMQDYSDAQYCFVVEQMTREEFRRKYPKAAVVSWEGAGEGDAWQWVEGERVRVAEYWWREPVRRHIYELADGRVVEVKDPQIYVQPAQPPMQMIDPMTGEAVMTPGSPEVRYVWGGGLPEPTPYVRDRVVESTRVMWCVTNGHEILDGPHEWAGAYIPIIPCLGEEVWYEGRRVLRGAFADAKDPQRLYNWARSNAVETLALAPKQPWVLTSRQIEGYERQWDQAWSRPSPYLLINPTADPPPQRLGGAIPDTGALQEALQAADDIKATTGIYDASLGARGNETSGRAILARQRQGTISTFVYYDNLAKAVRHTGRVLVDLIPRIYDTERVVRVIGEDGAEEWARVNVTDPATGRVVANDLGLGRYDVVVDSGPSYLTRRQEALDGLVSMLQAAPALAPVLIPEILENLDWPGARDIARRLKEQAQAPQADPEQEARVEGMKLDNVAKAMELQSRAAAAPVAAPPGAILPA